MSCRVARTSEKVTRWRKNCKIGHMCEIGSLEAISNKMPKTHKRSQNLTNLTMPLRPEGPV